MKILFIDDEPFLLEAIFDRLEFEYSGILSYLYAQNCSEALNLLKSNKDIEIVVIDGLIPIGENKTFIEYQAKFSYSVGNTLANYISVNYPQIKIIAYTVFDNLEIIKLFEKAGAFYICKMDANSFYELFEVIEYINANKKIPKKKPNIFIVHGHDDLLKFELKNYLQNVLKFNEPIILDEKPSKGKTIIEKFEFYSNSIDLVFVLLTNDDLIEINGSENYFQPRPNVFFELGYFFAKLERESVILISKNNIKLPTDISGIVYIDATNGINSVSEKIRNEVYKWIN